MSIIKHYLLIAGLEFVFTFALILIGNSLVKIVFGSVLVILGAFLIFMMGNPKCTRGLATVVAKKENENDTEYTLRFEKDKKIAKTPGYLNKYSEKTDLGARVNGGYYKNKEGTITGLIFDKKHILPAAKIVLGSKIGVIMGVFILVLGILEKLDIINLMELLRKIFL